MWALFFAQAVVNLPAYPPADALAAPTDPARLSIVVADTVSETDPQPLCDRADCTALFLGRYKHATVLAGPSLPGEFTARVEMGSPWITPYRLALLVEQREGREPLVRALAGFNESTNEACFDAGETNRLAWAPVGPRIVRKGGAICVQD